MKLMDAATNQVFDLLRGDIRGNARPLIGKLVEAVKTLVDKLNGKTPPKRMDLSARVITKADLDKPDVKALLNPSAR